MDGLLNQTSFERPPRTRLKRNKMFRHLGTCCLALLELPDADACDSKTPKRAASPDRNKNRFASELARATAPLAQQFNMVLLSPTEPRCTLKWNLRGRTDGYTCYIYQLRRRGPSETDATATRLPTHSEKHFLSILSCGHKARNKYVILALCRERGQQKQRNWTGIAPSESVQRCASVREIPDICETNFEWFLKVEGGGGNTER